MAGGVFFPHPWVADLGAVGVDGSAPINLTELTLHVGKAQTHVPRMLIREDLDKYIRDHSDFSSIMNITANCNFDGSEIVEGFVIIHR